MTFCFDFWSYVVVCVMFGLFLSAWPAVTSSLLVRFLSEDPGSLSLMKHPLG